MFKKNKKSNDQELLLRLDKLEATLINLQSYIAHRQLAHDEQKLPSKIYDLTNRITNLEKIVNSTPVNLTSNNMTHYNNLVEIASGNFNELEDTLNDK